jgi:hypothetical protein
MYIHWQQDFHLICRFAFTFMSKFYRHVQPVNQYQFDGAGGQNHPAVITTSAPMKTFSQPLLPTPRFFAVPANLSAVRSQQQDMLYNNAALYTAAAAAAAANSARQQVQFNPLAPAFIPLGAGPAGYAPLQMSRSTTNLAALFPSNGYLVQQHQQQFQQSMQQQVPVNMQQVQYLAAGTFGKVGLKQKSYKMTSTNQA